MSLPRDGDRKASLVSPLYADLRHLPPLLIQVGVSEVLLDDSRRLAERAGSYGVNVTLEVWPDMIHVWQLFAAVLPEIPVPANARIIFRESALRCVQLSTREGKS
jgi:acetyl esterase/lipase